MRVNARKIPEIRALLLLGQFLAAFATALPAQTREVLRRAARAESRYESAVRSSAPLKFSASSGRECDEVVGRYCIYFEGESDSLPTEPKPIDEARDSAIAALSRVVTVAPGRTPLVFSLVRLLVGDGRTAEAVEVARAYARATADTANAHMLLGLTLHADRQTPAAAEEFEGWLKLLPERDRERIKGLGWLLEDTERRRYEKLSAEARADYEARVWRFADPLYLTPGNELWTDHLARHVVSRMLEARGHAFGASWGWDLEQLTVRFGLPVRTTRSWSAGSIGSSTDYSDHWDPSERTYLPPSLSAALERPAPLDTVWPLDATTSRSGHAPPTIRAMKSLQGQVVAFADEVWFRGVVPVDSAVHSPSAGVFFLDSALNVSGLNPLIAEVLGDSAVVHGRARLPGDALYYSAELYDPGSRFGARSRFRLGRPASAAGLTLSGVLLAQPFRSGGLPENRTSPLLKPLTRPLIEAGDSLGIYAELQSASAERQIVQVELELKGLERASGFGRLAGWIGARLGISQPRSPARLSWSVELEGGGPTALPVTLDLGAVKEGPYRISLTVRQGGSELVAERDFLVVTSRASSSRRP